MLPYDTYIYSLTKLGNRGIVKCKLFYKLVLATEFLNLYVLGKLLTSIGSVYEISEERGIIALLIYDFT